MDSGETLADLAGANDAVIVVRGGDGGKGNRVFATAVNRSPRERTLGAKGEERTLHLELRALADVGLVGFPNAGKSSLLGKLTSARPPVADYAFTTLHPYIGYVDRADGRRVAVADIPGLVEDAHDDVGLGHRFLRHVARTRALLFVVDMSGPIVPVRRASVLAQEASRGTTKAAKRVAADGTAQPVLPWDVFKVLRKELAAYSDDLVAKSEDDGAVSGGAAAEEGGSCVGSDGVGSDGEGRLFAVVANKMDKEGFAEQLKAFKTKMRRDKWAKDIPVFPVSALTGEGMDALRGWIADHCAPAASGERT